MLAEKLVKVDVGEPTEEAPDLVVVQGGVLSPVGDGGGVTALSSLLSTMMGRWTSDLDCRSLSEVSDVI